MKAVKHILLCLMALLSVWGRVCAQRTNDLMTANDHVILLLDLRSPEQTLNDLLQKAGVEKANINALKNKDYSQLQKLGWTTTLMPGGDLLRMERSLADAANSFKFTVLPTSINRGNGYPAVVAFGVNNFARITVRELPDGTTRFFVPKRLDAKRVMLSGSFNHWSTLQAPMLKTDSGWIRDVRLEPGVYEYKYIFDGNWDIDRNNNLKIDGGAGSPNSVYYRYNFSFKLPGYQSAHRVTVSGTFNRWDKNQLVMMPVENGWELKMYLHDGIYLYNFLVDGKTITDPANKNMSGAENSVLNLGETVNFRLGGYEHATQAFVVGDFNGWKPNDLFMRKAGDTWVLPYTLAAGNYEYKFIVDGLWILDPTNPNKAAGGGQLNSFISVKPNHIFHLKGYGNAKKVILSGTFNNWNQNGLTMEHKGDEWTVGLYLKPGKYLYKFIIDGNWIIDPGNKLWEQNQYGTGNSVLWIE